MKSLREHQQAFGRFVLHGTGNFVQEIAKQGVISEEDRIRIYRNAYRQRLRECIETDHEVLAAYLGACLDDKSFDQLVDAYVDNCPSGKPSLRSYCDRLPEFLMNTAPFNVSPVVSEIAGFERVLLTAFDAADIAEQPQGELSGIAAEAWPGLVFDFHPSLSVYRCDWNAVQIWQSIKAARIPPPAERQPTERWLVWRNRELLTNFRSVSSAEAAVVEAWVSGATFADGCETALGFLGEAEVSAQVLQWLLSYLEEGIVTKVSQDRM